MKGHDIFGLPFRIKISSNNEIKIDTKEKLKNKNNNHINNYNDKTAITFSSSKKDTNTIIITIKPKEERLTNLILSDLSIINNMVNTAENILLLNIFFQSIYHLVKHYSKRKRMMNFI